MLRPPWLLAGLSACVTTAGVAQNAATGLYLADRIGSECVQIEGYPVTVENGECSVVDHGLLLAADGVRYFYARYLITAEVPSWPDLREILPDSNALVIFEGQDASDYLRVYRTYHEDFSAFGRVSFPAPAVLETLQGKVLNIRRRDAGGGMTQWFNDEYWLWRWNDWQRLDVASWYADIHAYLPSGYALGGVSYDHFDLVNLRNVSPVRRPDDANCCPSAGIISVSFGWVDLRLTIRAATYDPDTDFRSLSP